jgi:thioredoxin-related protein
VTRGHPIILQIYLIAVEDQGMDLHRLILWMALGLLTVLKAGAAPWLQSLEGAKVQAAAAHRPILIFFTSSDSCPDCQGLKATVLDNVEFHAFAETRLILLEVDSPRARPIAALQSEANRRVIRQYSVSTYPTLLLVDESGKGVGNLQGAGTAPDLIRVLDQVIARAYGTTPQKTAAPVRPPVISATPVREAPPFGGAITQPAPVYTNLVLKSITGSPSRRFALINSETLSAGDTTRVKLGERKLNVRCVEVQEKTVIVQVEGERGTRELKLNPPVNTSGFAR